MNSTPKLRLVYLVPGLSWLLLMGVVASLEVHAQSSTGALDFQESPVPESPIPSGLPNFSGDETSWSSDSPNQQETPTEVATAEPSKAPNCDKDGDGVLSTDQGCNGTDCNDDDKNINPQASEKSDQECADNTDNDCDGATDCADLECRERTESNDIACTDSLDNDCDGNVDCFDEECNGKAGWIDGIVTLSPTGICCNPIVFYDQQLGMIRELVGVVPRHIGCTPSSPLTCYTQTTPAPPILEEGKTPGDNFSDKFAQPPPLNLPGIGTVNVTICRLPKIGHDGEEEHPPRAPLEDWFLLLGKPF